MARAPNHIVTISPDIKIAQLVILPLTKQGAVLQKHPREIMVLVPLMLPIRLELMIKDHTFQGHLDTGADVSVIAQHCWPSSWPTHAAVTELQGIGQSRSPLQSSNILH